MGNNRRQSKSRQQKHRSRSRNNQKSKAKGGNGQSLTKIGSFVTQTWDSITDYLQPEKALNEKSLEKDESALIGEELCTKDMAIVESKSRLVFYCQLAHGSPTCLVSGFNNQLELYEKIASCYDGVTKDQILFCTRNSHRIDMNALFVSTLAISDFLFAHLAGQKKEVELMKTKKMLGITVTDNGAGRVFIRKIEPGSLLFAAQNAIEVGDHIEKINNVSMVGKRHFQVAIVLRAIQLDEKFSMRLISPMKSGFSFVSKSQPTSNKMMIAADAQTIRFKSVGDAVIQEPPNAVVIVRLNEIFSSYLGFQDDELALTVLDIGRNCSSLLELEKQVESSSLAEFQFPAEFIFDLWGAIDDWKKDEKP